MGVIRGLYKVLWESIGGFHETYHMPLHIVIVSYGIELHNFHYYHEAKS